jgi:hypothetical protein
LAQDKPIGKIARSIRKPHDGRDVLGKARRYSHIDRSSSSVMFR